MAELKRRGPSEKWHTPPDYKRGLFYNDDGSVIDLKGLPSWEPSDLEVVHDPPAAVVVKKRYRYPWDQWFGEEYHNKVLALTRGRHYFTDEESFRKRMNRRCAGGDRSPEHLQRWVFINIYPEYGRVLLMPTTMTLAEGAAWRWWVVRKGEGVTGEYTPATHVNSAYWRHVPLRLWMLFPFPQWLDGEKRLLATANARLHGAPKRYWSLPEDQRLQVGEGPALVQAAGEFARDHPGVSVAVSLHGSGLWASLRLTSAPGD